MYATIIEQQPLRHLTTQEERDAMLARNQAQRNSQRNPHDFTHYDLVNIHHAEQEEAKKNGWPRRASDWRVYLHSSKGYTEEMRLTKQGYCFSRIYAADNAEMLRILQDNRTLPTRNIVDCFAF